MGTSGTSCQSQHEGSVRYSDDNQTMLWSDAFIAFLTVVAEIIRLSLSQEVPCGSTCKWLPSGTRTTRWFCSSARLKTSPSSSSPSKTKPQKVSVSPRQAGRQERSFLLQTSLHKHSSVCASEDYILAVLLLDDSQRGIREKESEFLWWIFFYFIWGFSVLLDSVQ